MPIPSITEVMVKVEPHLDLWDAVVRHGHAVYQSYPPEIAIDFDASTQAHCTYRHILAEAFRAFEGNTLHFDIRGLKLWLFEQAEVVIRLKKMDADGRSSNFPTRQALAFDRGAELPGLPSGPTRLTVGYLLDETGSSCLRTQVSLPVGRGVGWCAAIVPTQDRLEAEPIWVDVTREHRLL